MTDHTPKDLREVVIHCDSCQKQTIDLVRAQGCWWLCHKCYDREHGSGESLQDIFRRKLRGPSDG